MKVYCKNCKHCVKVISGESASCTATKQIICGDNKYINNVITRIEHVYLDENKDGTCMYYYPNVRTRVKAFLIKRFK